MESYHGLADDKLIRFETITLSVLNSFEATELRAIGRKFLNCLSPVVIQMIKDEPNDLREPFTEGEKHFSGIHDLWRQRCRLIYTYKEGLLSLKLTQEGVTSTLPDTY